MCSNPRNLSPLATMSNPAKFLPVNETKPPLTISERRDVYETRVTRPKDGGDEQEPLGLYHVTLKRKIEGRHPIFSTFYVLAPDEAGAISQVEGKAFPEKVGIVLTEEETASLTSTAFRIPFYIRGWGDNNF